MSTQECVAERGAEKIFNAITVPATKRTSEAVVTLLLQKSSTEFLLDKS